MRKFVIFTDLDGTLLDSQTYSFKEAEPALELIRKHRIPLIICSSKTRAEIEAIREAVGNKDPFISENGGAIFIPLKTKVAAVRRKNYVVGERRGLPKAGKSSLKTFRYEVITLGEKYSVLRKALKKIREKGFSVKGFGDMTAEEISELTSLDLESAALAKEREFDEPFLFFGDEAEIPAMKEAVEGMGLRITEGRFWHLIGNSDKGKAVETLIETMKVKMKDFVSIGIGDSGNDLEMLEKVDYPVVVRQADGGIHPALSNRGFIISDAAGPAGFNVGITWLLKKLGG